MIRSDAPSHTIEIGIAPRVPSAAAPIPRAPAVAGSCAACSLKRVCLPRDLEGDDLERFSRLARLKRTISQGARLVRAGQALEAVYAIHSGTMKTTSVSRDGIEKVTGFYLCGDLLGLGAISTGTHTFNAVALESSEVCVIPFERLRSMAYVMPDLQQQLLRVLSAEISRDAGLMLLGGLDAEQRVAAFLLNLAQRYRMLGYSPDVFVLRMTREEIGNYIGLTLETVSRVISRLRRARLISVKHREVRLENAAGLCNMVGISEPSGRRSPACAGIAAEPGAAVL